MQERRKVDQAPSALGAFTRHPATIAILALGITQIVAWGTTLYALGVLGKPIAADTGWSQTIVFGGLTIGLLVSGATSTFVGRLIDRRGGQSVMAIGSMLVAVGLVLLARAEHRDLSRRWASSPAMRMTLYDAASRPWCRSRPRAAARHLLPDAVRRLRSSVFWPIGHALNTLRLAHDARDFAAINLRSACRCTVRAGAPRTEAQAITPDPRCCRRAGGPSARRCAARDRHGAVRSSFPQRGGVRALAVHLVPLLEASGLTRPLPSS